MDKSNANSTSLNKFISQTGICSRREADALIKEGRVTLNGQPCRPGNRVFEGDEVRVNGKLIGQKPEPLYIAFNKPVGIVCTTDPREPDNIIRYINHPQRIFPIGRLDKASQGLIFLTNDGDIVNKILRAENAHEKEYVVTVNKPITKAFLKNMQQGVPILGTVTQPCRAWAVGECRFKIVLTQGMNRQIRRMCKHLGYGVSSLKRLRIMNIDLGDLSLGTWREFNAVELQNLQKQLRNSGGDPS